MKLQLQFLSYLVVLLITIASCSKDKEVRTYPPASVVSSPPSGFIVGNKEYFWARPWHKTSRGYEIHLDTWKLTDSTINKGINLYVAIWTEMTTFDSIPLTFYEYTQSDSVHLSYTAIRGQLQVIAEAPFEVRYVSDVFIEYQ